MARSKSRDLRFSQSLGLLRSLAALIIITAFMQWSVTAARCAEATKAPKRPNVIVIMADDFGAELLGCNGGTSYKTPVLDKLAASGVRFDYCFAQPLCTPTRVQMMTGIYNVRNYIRFGLLDPEAKTFAHLFKQAGYATGIVGKWQLGRDFALPAHFGFDEYCLWQLTRRPSRYKDPGLEINGKEVDLKGKYGPDIVNDYALDFVAKHKDHPFFLYYPMMLTHSPYLATPDSTDWNESKAEGAGKGEGNSCDADDAADGEPAQGKRKQARAEKKAGKQAVKQTKQAAAAAGEGKAAPGNPHFRDMVQYTDKMVGKLLARLEELGLRENTLVLFTGDNGTGAGTRSQVGDRTVIGAKGSTIDMGMRVPLVVSWPAGMQGGRTLHDLVDMTDFLPTICEAAGVEVPSQLSIDGHSFLPQIRGQAGQPRDWIYCWYAPDGGQKAKREFARNQNFKLDRDGTLYDVSSVDDDKHPLDAGKLTPEQQAAKKLLQQSLDKYEHARPKKL